MVLDALLSDVNFNEIFVVEQREEDRFCEYSDNCDEACCGKRCLKENTRKCSDYVNFKRGIYEM